jgi:hypothetical protein
MGNGAIGNAVTNIVAEPGTGNALGQGQESGRDQGHSGLDWQLLAAIGQQSWNQGEDLFWFDDNRFLKGYASFMVVRVMSKECSTLNEPLSGDKEVKVSVLVTAFSFRRQQGELPPFTHPRPDVVSLTLLANPGFESAQDVP